MHAPAHVFHIQEVTPRVDLQFMLRVGLQFNPLTDDQPKHVRAVLNKFVILVHFLDFVKGVKRSTSEQLAG